MAPKRIKRISYGQMLATMLAVSALCLLLPADLTARLKAVSQPLIPLQAIVYRSVGRVSCEAKQNLQAPAQRSERDALAGRLLLLTEQLQRLRTEYARLAGLRRYIPRRLGKLLPADVISKDSLAYRSILAIDRGYFSGAVHGQWVTSAVYLDRGTQDGLKPNLAVLASEGLIGRLCWVGPYMSKVMLLTDPASRVKVRIARIGPDGVRYTPGEWMLEGLGNGKMIIRQVDYRLIKSGTISPGDLVISTPSADLPVVLRIGRIVEARRQEKTPVVYDLLVEPAIEAEALRHVFVLDPTPVE